MEELKEILKSQLTTACPAQKAVELTLEKFC